MTYIEARLAAPCPPAPPRVYPFTLERTAVAGVVALPCDSPPRAATGGLWTLRRLADKPVGWTCWRPFRSRRFSAEVLER